MTYIICLANSWKRGERCIAGIEPSTNRWIRPVCSQYPQDGRVPENVRLIHRREPKLLDIIDIPLADTGPDFGFECENLTILPGQWQKVGRVEPVDLLPYCSNSPQILHNDRRYVKVSFMQSLPFEQRETLQLIYVSELRVNREIISQNGQPRARWKGTMITANGRISDSLTITDPELFQRLEWGKIPQYPYLITVSLSMPFKPSDDWDEGDCCWKLIAGAIELSPFHQILIEMKRIGWSKAQGRDYLQQTYQKQSRQQLNLEEISSFLTYLQKIPAN
jgi:hypothetical protein